MEDDAMTVRPEAASSAAAGDMPIREMNEEPQPGATAASASEHECEKLRAYLREQQGEMVATRPAQQSGMSTREMNAAIQPVAMAVTQPMPEGETRTRPMDARPRSRPMSGTEAAGGGEMPIREMNTESQQRGIVPVGSAH